jgi:small GTP-binding protein
MTQETRYNAQRRIFEDEIRKQYAELQKHKPNILVVGRTGVGKSTLINAVLGEKLAETGAGKPITKSYAIYEHPLVNMIDSKGWEGGAEGDQSFRDDTKRLLQQRRTTNPDEHIHVVWYVLAASDARFQEYDAQLVREAFGGIPVLFVLTKCDTARDADIAQVEQAITDATKVMAQQATKYAPAPRIVGVIRTAADPLPILGREPWGVKEVVDATQDELPALYRDAFDAAQAVDFSRKAARARAVVAAAAATAGGIGFVPIPFSDAALLSPLQIGMVSSIAIIYGFGADPGSLTALISGAMVPLVAESAGVTLAGNLIKLFPGAGSIVGGMVDGTVAASVTATIGYAFQQVFHQLALIKARDQQAVGVDAAAAFLKQALPQALQEVRRRGLGSFLPGGNDKDQ